MKIRLTCAWITTFQAAIQSSRASATIKRPYSSPAARPGFAEQNAFGSTQNIENHGRNAALSETHIFSSNSINQINVGYNRIFNYIQSFGSGTCKSEELGIPGANLGGISCGLTSTSVGGGWWSLGDRGFSPFQGGTNIFTVSDSFDMIRGKHNIKIGGEFRANQMNVETNAFQDGFWVSQTGGALKQTATGGNNIADFLWGVRVLPCTIKRSKEPRLADGGSCSVPTSKMTGEYLQT